MKVAIVTDSACCLPIDIVDRYAIKVAPLGVTLDGVASDDGSIDLRGFIDRLAKGASPTTSQPPPGAFLRLYEEAVAEGAEEILSVHIGSKLSGTLGSVRVAAESSPIPVTVADTGAASFQEGLCVWEAAEALAAGASVADAQQIAEAAGRASGNIFTVGALELVARGGRLVGGKDVRGVPILTVSEGGIGAVGSANTVEEAIAVMADHVATAPERLDRPDLRVGVTHIQAAEMAEELKSRLAAIPQVKELLDYVLAPSMAAHSGPGTVSAIFIGRPVITSRP
jgi:fatty acid kinase fatty acid binding subunit